MNKTTKVVNKYHKEPYDIYIGRGSIWGNPFSHMSGTKAKYLVSSREEAVSRYEEWIMNQPNLLNRIHELEGKTLCCFCKPKSCHGDILAKLANSGKYSEK